MMIMMIMTIMIIRLEMQGKYEKKKEAVSEEMEVEASKMEKDVEEDFGVICNQILILI